MTTGNVPARAMSREEARRRTDEFKAHTEAWLEELAALYIDQVWWALDYETFDEYCAAELGSIRLPRAGRREAVLTLRDAGLSIRAISSALRLGRGHDSSRNRGRCPRMGHLTPRTWLRK